MSSNQKYIKRFINGTFVLLSDKENKQYNKTGKFKTKPKTKVKVNKTNLQYKSYKEIIPSEAEAKIMTILKALSISFIRECEFIDCKNPKTDKHLRFDFYLPKYNMCIEYDGNQHFEIDKTIDPELATKRLEEYKYRDSIKNQYCRTKRIKLIRLSAKQYYNLEEALKSILIKSKN